MKLLKLNKKIKKTHNKVRFVGNKNYLVNKQYVSKLTSAIKTVGKKSRKWLFRNLAKVRLVQNYRALIIKQTNEHDTEMNLQVDGPLKNFYYRFQYPILRSLEHYPITSTQLEMIRRFSRKFFGKRVFVRIMITPYKILLRRTNQVRMGGGKGSKPYKSVYPLKPGSSILEIRGVKSRNSLYKFFRKLEKKFPFKMTLSIVNRI